MEDKRIRKTKKNLKSTLIKMLSELSFSQISITELCKRADTSRITFYSHYSDKYALVDEIFEDMLEIGTKGMPETVGGKVVRNDGLHDFPVLRLGP